MSINIMPATPVFTRAGGDTQSPLDPAQPEIHPILQDSRNVGSSAQAHAVDARLFGQFTAWAIAAVHRPA